MASALKGGNKLKAYAKRMKRATAQANEMVAGFPGGDTYPDGTPVAHIAAIQEYGAPEVGIPARPFFRNAIADNGPKWSSTMAQMMKVTGNDVNKALALLGEQVQSDIQQSIINFSDPGNAPFTIAQKGFDDPLIDSGDMLRSVTYQVGSDNT